MKKQEFAEEEVASEDLETKTPEPTTAQTAPEVSDSNHIGPHSDGYQAMYAFWRKDEGTVFVYGGASWTAVRDNDDMVFHRTGSLSGLDGAYESYTIEQS